MIEKRSESGQDEWTRGGTSFNEIVTGANGGDGKLLREMCLYPVLDGLLGNVFNQKVLDAGCWKWYLYKEITHCRGRG